MKTITAKEFRKNLANVIESVANGEDIVVKHRFMDPIVLSALNKNKRPDTIAALAAFDAAPKKEHNFSPNKSIKELYHEMLEEKYGQ